MLRVTAKSGRRWQLRVDAVEKAAKMKLWN